MIEESPFTSFDEAVVVAVDGELNESAVPAYRLAGRHSRRSTVWVDCGLWTNFAVISSVGLRSTASWEMETLSGGLSLREP
ncbi:MAG: hypothetical protein A3D92_13460 [Bacteroidetes bacterium RIFCSPHIGHO2_02_FULL_44_7]|nr:MAG: hypothetical protein A3D92_13460 [Bacteroidetes bacterium RIFCSPHIGHO2_02_FULL_44_7]